MSSIQDIQKNVVRAVIAIDTLSPEGIQVRLDELQRQLVKAIGNQKSYDAIIDEILRLQQMKKVAKVDAHNRDEAVSKIKELQEFIKEQNAKVTDFDETLVRKLHITYHRLSRNCIVEFKSGAGCGYYRIRKLLTVGNLRRWGALVCLMKELFLIFLYTLSYV